MKIKAKKTNSASENEASSYRVAQTDSLIAFNFVRQRVTLQHSYVIVPLYVGRFHSKNKNTDQSYQWPATFAAGLF